MSDTLKAAFADLNIDASGRPDRRAELRRLAVEDERVLRRLTMEKRAGGARSDELNAERLRFEIIDACEAFGITKQNLPRGYDVMGTGHVGGPTPNYLRKNSERVSDDVLLADAQTGFIEELNAKLASIIDAARAKVTMAPGQK